MSSGLANSCRCCLASDDANLLIMVDSFLFAENDKLLKNPKILDCYFEHCVSSSVASRGPLKICPSCRVVLQNFVTFRSMCRESNEKFQSQWPSAVNIICNDIQISEKYAVSEVLISEVKSEPNSEDDLPLAGRLRKESGDTEVEVPAKSTDRKRKHKYKKGSKKRRKLVEPENEANAEEPVIKDDPEEILGSATDVDEPSYLPEDVDFECGDPDEDIDQESTFVCLFCEETFESLHTFLRHRRRVHPKKDPGRFRRNCPMCDGGKEVEDFEEHLAAEHVDFKPNKCKHCDETFQSYGELRSHLSQHGTDKQFQCMGCNTYHQSEYALRRHIIVSAHNSEKTASGRLKKLTFNCHVCGMEFERVAEMALHVDDAHPTEQGKRFFPCFHCKKVFSSMAGYKVDFKKTCSQSKAVYESKKKRLNQVKAFGCDSCDQKFYEEEELQCHTIALHRYTTENCYCDDCNINYHTIGELRLHIKKVHADKYKQQANKKNFMCAVCGKCCDTKGRLQQHAVSHVEDRPEKCDKCPAAFKHKSNLRSHMKLHTVKRNIECNECGKFFTSLHYVKVHLSRCHFPSIRRFKCDLCPRTMTTVTEKKRHQRTHTGERPFKCNICDRSYATEAGLTGHVQTNHTLIRYECKFCDKKLALKISMWKHIFSHRGFYPFNCPACNYGCFPKELIKRHMLKHHNLEYDEDVHGYHAETFDEVIASGIKVTPENAPNFRANQINLNNEINYLNYVAMETIEKEMQQPLVPKVENTALTIATFSQPPPLAQPMTAQLQMPTNYAVNTANLPVNDRSNEGKAKYLQSI